MVDCEEKLKKINLFLDSPTHLVVSSKGRYVSRISFFAKVVVDPFLISLYILVSSLKELYLLIINM